MDIPILVDWLWRAYQVISQSVAYINFQIVDNPDITVTDLPNPQTSTVAQAQTTANQAYILATDAGSEVEDVKEILARNTTGTVLASDGDTGKTVNFSEAQPDTSYTVFVQAKSSGGTPVTDAFIITSKTYNTGSFSFTMKDAPGVGNSITFEWQLVRNS